MAALSVTVDEVLRAPLVGAYPPVCKAGNGAPAIGAPAIRERIHSVMKIWTSGRSVLVTACLICTLLITMMAKAQSTVGATPLSLSANGRYLVDQNHVPYLLQGDAAWSLIVATDDQELEQYLKNRRDKGFNALLVNLVEHLYSKNPPLDAAGDPPFMTPGDFTTPNEKYFAHADKVIREAGENGMQVLLAPIYLGYVGTQEGWIEELMKLKPERCLEYGQYLGKRYKDFNNIIWVMGGDRDPKSALERVDLIALGIKEFDKRHLFTAHANSEPSTPEQFGSGGWLDINSSYSCETVHERLSSDYNHQPILPTFLIESCYEGEHNSSHAQIRRQAYWAVLCGGFGHVFGNNPIWHFDGPTLYPFKGTWQQALDLPGSVDVMYWGRVLRSRPWFDLVPDQKHEVITGGLGEFLGDDYLAAGRTPDGSTVIAYMPTKRTISMDMSKISGAQALAWWYDPRTGKAISAGAFETSGMRELTPPSDDDWVLVVDDGSVKRLPPGVTH